MTNTKIVFGLTMAALMTISIIAISTVPSVFAKPSDDEPDLIATLTAIGDHKGKGKAEFWFNDDTNPTELTYKIVFNKVDVGTELTNDEYENLKDKNNGKGLENHIEKIHIHYAPNGVHMSEHFFNIVGPNDDDDLKIAGHTISGIWDDGDATGHHGHSTKPFTEKLQTLCEENTDVNVHLGENKVIRGQIYKNTDVCDDLFG